MIKTYKFVANFSNKIFTNSERKLHKINLGRVCKPFSLTTQIVTHHSV